MKLVRRSFLSLVLLLPSVALAQQQAPAALQQTSARLAGEVLVNGRAMEYVQNLSDKFGGRLSGSPDLTFDTDHGHFMLAGIPALDLWVDMEHYDDVHHKSSDTLDKVVAHNLVAGSALVAITAHALAERPERIAPQLKRDAVGALLK
ncbi:MAG TPA: M28 family peptidase, partial [Pyrinomonadaceae bacterium]